MKVFVADNAGACYGVSRSLEIVEHNSNDGIKTATLGELIHNPQVVQDLAENFDVVSVDSVNQAISNNISRLIIRSHGVSVDTLNECQNSNLEIIDATCPYVKNVQNTASLMASLYPAVIIIGKHGHPEVKSVASFIENNNSRCFVGETVEEIDNFLPALLQINDSIGVVSQTTQSVEVFEDMVAYLKSRGIKLEVENTICVATQKRQSSAIELSKNVDAMIVIGGHNSSNTNHLALLCEENCKNVFHIETESDINLENLQEFKSIGITAGASTPHKYVDVIVNKLQNA